MNKEFVTYEQALALKELGFDEPCLGLYHNDKTLYPTQCKSQEQYHGQICSAPLYQQAFRWFREKHNLMFQLFYLRNGNHYVIIHRTTPEYMDLVDQVKPSSACFDEVVDCYSYEEAESACLDKLIEIIKNKTNE